MEIDESAGQRVAGEPGLIARAQCFPLLGESFMVISGSATNSSEPESMMMLMRGCRSLRNERNGIALSENTRLGDCAIEREFAGCFLHDLAEDAEVLLEAVGVECGHHASHAQLRYVDDHLARPETGTGPVPFCLPSHATDNNVRAQPSKVHVQFADGSVGCDEQGQNIEPLGALAGIDKANRLPCCFACQGESFG